MPIAGRATTSAPSSSSASNQLARLLAGPRDDDAAAEERAGVEPAQVLAEAGDRADDQQRRAPLDRAVRDLADRALDGLLRGRGRVVDEHRRLFGRAAVRDQRSSDRANLPRRGEADQRAPDRREMLPVDPRRLAGLRLVAAEQGHHVAGAGIGERDAGIGRPGNRQRHAWDHFERNAILVKEHRFLAAAVEQERIAPLEPHHHLVLARLLGEQKGDGVLVERPSAPRPRRRSAPRSAGAHWSSRSGTRWS